MNEPRLLVLPGDGVGPEVTAQSLRVLNWFRDRRKLGAHLTERPFDRAAWIAHGTLLAEETWAQINIAAPGEPAGTTAQMGDAVIAALAASL